MLVFVYGTLKSGGRLNRVLKEDKCLGLAYTVNEAFDLFSDGGFPYLWSGKHRIRGELYDVGEDTLNRLDYIEGVPRHYRQVKPLVAYECEGAKAEVEAVAYMAAGNYGFNENMDVGVKLEHGTNAKYWEND